MGQEEISYNERKDEVSNLRKVDSTISANEDRVKNEYVRLKMEEMQRRIDELKEKVKQEGEILHNGEATLKLNNFDEQFLESLNSLGLQNNFESGIQARENNSEQSLYFSASSYSLCSVSSSSTDSAYCNFTKFVSNFVRSQNQQERLSLLQLHSNKQISLNMMRNSLAELDSRCSAELELVERNLQHLEKLSEEFNVKRESQNDSVDCKSRALEFNDTNNILSRKRKTKTRPNQSFIWSPLKVNRPEKLDWSHNPAFEKID